MEFMPFAGGGAPTPIQCAPLLSVVVPAPLVQGRWFRWKQMNNGRCIGNPWILLVQNRSDPILGRKISLWDGPF